MVRAIICDIEGTTTSLSFVHQILFPISLQKMDQFVRDNWESNIVQTLNIPTPEATSALLKSWIQADKKDTILKSIQGNIWKQGFESGQIRGHIYPDVPVSFQKWKNSGIRISIFSSGSVEAQRLILQYSEAGDLSPFIDHYFDTTTGQKRDPASYEKIAKELDLSPHDLLFLSDVTEELNAARIAGIQTIQILREGTAKPQQSTHRTVTSFDEIPDLNA